MDEQETYRRVWPEYDVPLVSYGLSYYEACAKHVKDLGASRVYIVVSKSLTRNGDYLQRLKTAIGEENIVNVRVGMKHHSMYSEVIEVAKEVQKLRVDCLITLGGGSLIDAGKGAILASLSPPLPAVAANAHSSQPTPMRTMRTVSKSLTSCSAKRCLDSKDHLMTRSTALQYR